MQYFIPCFSLSVFRHVCWALFNLQRIEYNSFIRYKFVEVSFYLAFPNRILIKDFLFPFPFVFLNFKTHELTLFAITNWILNFLNWILTSVPYGILRQWLFFKFLAHSGKFIIENATKFSSLLSHLFDNKELKIKDYY